MPDPYKDSSEEVRGLVSSIVGLRDSQEEIANRITERDHEFHTGGTNFLVRMERIMGHSNVMHKVEAKSINQPKRRKRGENRSGSKYKRGRR